jgi:hypothetical protein
MNKNFLAALKCPGDSPRCRRHVGHQKGVVERIERRPEKKPRMIEAVDPSKDKRTGESFGEII